MMSDFLDGRSVFWINAQDFLAEVLELCTVEGCSVWFIFRVSIPVHVQFSAGEGFKVRITHGRLCKRGIARVHDE